MVAALQLSLFDPAETLVEAVERLSTSGNEERGAVFTRREVVDFILDLVGYTADKRLWELRLLEPAFGQGDFLTVAVERLIESWKRDGNGDVCRLESAILGVEVHRKSFFHTAGLLEKQMVEQGIQATTAAHLVKTWLQQKDFLLMRVSGCFDLVVGNPPYVRQESIPNDLLLEYRRQFSTMYDRADLYVPFIEKTLSLLAEGGVQGFICSDRWMKNRYGGPLREMVSDRFHLRYYVDMVDTDAFAEGVSAYPAITVIAREKGRITRVAHRPQICANALAELVVKLTGESVGFNGTVQELSAVAAGAEPWMLEQNSLEVLHLARRLEAQFPILEDAGCKVGIGVATGADRVFIAPMDQLDVEPSRKLPLVTTKDLDSGEVAWRGLGVINPFGDDGDLVDLQDYPLLAKHFERHGSILRQRHVAKKGGTSSWYRTIDKITPSLAHTPKLLIPDIKGTAQVVLEESGLYPHHNLYYITAEEWDLRALRAVLMSGIARLFVGMYSTKMRGGFLRFQAQYLRRIRLPRWGELALRQREALVAAAAADDSVRCNDLVAEIYGLSRAERDQIEKD